MRQFRLLVLFAVLCSAAFAYQYPIKGVKKLHSASFAEMRPDHFHSGVDIKTDGAQGKEVVAAADGYISRVQHSPYGYGLAVYVTHPKLQTMTVYAHLSRFTEPVAEVVKNYRYEHHRNSADIVFSPEQFPVSAGEIIGYSGNTGNSFGPHLHYELRNEAGTHTYNIVRRGLFRPKDSVAPQLLQLHYVEVDTLSGVAVEAVRRSFQIKRSGKGYSISGDIKVGRNGYFIVECRDRQNDNATSRFGVYRISQRVDGTKTFEYRNDGYAFADTRYCDLVSYYPLQRSANCEVIRLVRMAAAPDYLYRVQNHNGAVTAAAGEKRVVEIEVEDDCGNISRLNFNIVGKPDNQLFAATCCKGSVIAGAGSDVMLAEWGTHLFVGRHSLYEPAFCRLERSGVRPQIEDLATLSESYRVLDSTLPIDGYITVSIDAIVPQMLQTKCCIALKGRKGGYSNLGGYYAAGRVHARTRRAGEMVVVADTVAPTVRPNWRSGADLRSSSRISFKVSDNFSGIESYELYIDGEWKPLGYAPLQSTLYHTFDTPLAAGKKSTHTVRLRVTDSVGNKTIFEDKFYR